MKLHFGKHPAPPGNRTRVARMGILHDTTTPAALTSIFPLFPGHNTPTFTLLLDYNSGDVGDWTRDLSHAKRTLYHWATSPSINTFIPKAKKMRYWLYFPLKLLLVEEKWVRWSPSFVTNTWLEVYFQISPCTLLNIYQLVHSDIDPTEI